MKRENGGINMKFNVIEREPDYCFSGIRSNLENLLNAVMVDDVKDMGNRIYQPLSEVRENEKEYKVSIQLPGVKKEDINIELDNNTMIISAESKFEEAKENENENIHYSQLSYGKFSKTIEFAKDIDADHSNCEYKDGILQVTLRKLEEKKTTKTLKIQ